MTGTEAQRHLREHNLPRKRIAALRTKRPTFVSNRDGWRKFYRRQDQNNHQLGLSVKLETLRSN